MKDRILLGLGRHMIPIPRVLWQPLITRTGRRMRAGLAFMSEQHHAVRDLVVTELPRTGAPMAAGTIAARLGLPVDRITAILDQLERRLIFLARNAEGAVTWAYPVTVDETPHHASFSTGEEAYSP